MRDAVIVDVVRTPSGKGKPGGQLSGVHPARLLGLTLRALVERTGVDPALIDDVITGCASQAGEQASNIGRNAVLGAGFPEHVPATTLDRRCGSSQQAAHFAAQGVMAGAYDVVIACGVESMSRVPIPFPQAGRDPRGPDVHARYPDGLINQGVAAERIAARYGLDRAEMDAFAVRSHNLAAKAHANGTFDAQLVAVDTLADDGARVTATTDETLRPSTDVEGLSTLRSAFRSPEMAARFPELTWDITAGNSSPVTDGAAAALIMSAERAEELGVRPQARFHAFSVIGDDPMMMLLGPIPATERVLARAGLTIDQIDAFEVNEAFASVPLAWHREYPVPLERLNSNGGAIALGHPLGATGVRLLGSLVSTLQRNDWRYGLQTMCEGGGLANATVVERL